MQIAMVDVYVGIGSNIAPEENLCAALAELTAAFGVVECSSVYRSPAFGFEGADFLNLVVRFSSELTAEEIESRLSAIEYSGGRQRSSRKFGPRTLDLDLLLYGALVDARLRLPRDDVARYPFVLGPLAEMAPDLEHPLSGRTMKTAWNAMARENAPLVRLGPLRCSPEASPPDASSAVHR
jgi:2-amino-4-hydroxy-6-hydroxymethyldihydropteridine diphosphokinase